MVALDDGGDGSSPTSGSGASAATTVRQTFHCNSVWDESHGGIEADIRGDLSNPDTLDMGRVQIGPLKTSGGYHEMMVYFTAINDFGNRVRLIAYADIDAGTCDVTYYGFDAAS